MTEHDLKTGRELLEEEFIKKSDVSRLSRAEGREKKGGKMEQSGRGMALPRLYRDRTSRLARAVGLFVVLIPLFFRAFLALFDGQIWVQELELMVKRKEKAEIQALSNFGFQYLTQEYLPRKLAEADWV